MHEPLIRLMSACAVLVVTTSVVSAFLYGLPASISDFPFVVALYDKEWTTKDEDQHTKIVPFCTGTIVTAKFVLTTYSCLREEGGEYHLYRKDRIFAKDIRIVAGTAYGPVDHDHIFRYTQREAKQFLYPNEDDHLAAFAFESPSKLAEVHGENYLEYFVFEKDGTTHKRWYLDLALIEVDPKWKWSRYVLPAIFPPETAALSRMNWNDTVRQVRAGQTRLGTCYAVGWGGFSPVLQQVRLRKAEIYYVNYENCELSYCGECSFCNQTLRVDKRVEKCYKSILHGDACAGDIGAPLWCPAPYEYTARDFGGVKIRDDTGGHVVGVLSYWKGCFGKNVPSIYQHVWNVYDFISRTVGYKFPPNVWIYEDWISG